MQFGTLGSGSGQFNGQLHSNLGVAVDSLGNICVADTGNHRIQEFSSSGAYVSQFGTPGSGNGNFIYPFGVALDSSENVWVVDNFTSCISDFSVVPEPSSLALAALGFISLAAWRLRCR
jgi:tripartite motif-containing protein 71